MKVDAKVRWLIDDSELRIAVDDVETALVDLDYAEDEEDIRSQVREELCTKHDNMLFGDDEFMIENISDIVASLQFPNLGSLI